jgi:hypothetical protein
MEICFSVQIHFLTMARGLFVLIKKQIIAASNSGLDIRAFSGFSVNRKSLIKECACDNVLGPWVILQQFLKKRQVVTRYTER